MNAQTMVNWYGRMVRLYPRRFREEFGEEMKAVFSEAVEESQREGQWAAWRVFLLECADLPVNLIREHASSTGVQRMIERILTNRKYSRRRMAGALGFALAFFLFEALHGLYQILQPGVGAYQGFGGIFRLDLMGSYSGTSAVAVPWFLDLLFLFFSGLAAGWVFQRAGEIKGIRSAVAGSLSIGGAWTLITLVGLFILGLGNSGIIAAIVFIVLLLSSGALIAIIFGATSGLQPMNKVLELGGPGIAGYLIGLLGKMAAGSVLLLPWWGIALTSKPGGPTIPLYTALIGTWLVSSLTSALQGWIFGAWVGDQLGGDPKREGITLPQSHSPSDRSSIGYQTASGSTSSSGSGPVSPCQAG